MVTFSPGDSSRRLRYIKLTFESRYCTTGIVKILIYNRLSWNKKTNNIKLLSVYSISSVHYMYNINLLIMTWFGTLVNKTQLDK